MSVAEVRSFNRFWTARIGVLGEGILGTPWSLTEARAIYELAQRDETEFGALRRAMGIDAGQLSRLLARFEERGMVRRERSPQDARRQLVRLTPEGRGAFELLDARSASEIGELLDGLGAAGARRLLAAMAELRAALGPLPPPRLRDPQPGEWGWMVARHGTLYAQEFGWNVEFERLAAGVIGGFREAPGQRAWIADVGGAPAGCVLCVRREGEADTGQLRCLLVEPWARGLGVGGLLVDACIAFARDYGYASLVLWTNDVLRAARRIYERRGFVLEHAEPHTEFGPPMVGETWRLTLAAPRTRP